MLLVYYLSLLPCIPPSPLCQHACGAPRPSVHEAVLRTPASPVSTGLRCGGCGFRAPSVSPRMARLPSASDQAVGCVWLVAEPGWPDRVQLGARGQWPEVDTSLSMGNPDADSHLEVSKYPASAYLTSHGEPSCLQHGDLGRDESCSRCLRRDPTVPARILLLPSPSLLFPG